MKKKKNQLFKKIPPLELVIKLIKTFGFTSFDDRRCFSRQDLIDLKTVQEIYKLKPELDKYYLPCKSRTYLNSLTEKNVITILRQCLRIYGYSVFSREKYMKGEKFIIYNICPLSEKKYTPIEIKPYLNKKKSDFILKFD